MTTATIYVRQSKDRSGEGLAVERQEAQCRDLCARLGFDVGPVYRDNNRSATNGKPRRAFDEMLASRPEVIVCWAQDRLARLGPDLEKVIALEISVHSVTGSVVDLTTVDGRLTARLMCAVATAEIERKSKRQEAATIQERSRGVQPMGRHRAFGFHRDGSVDEVEAAEIRKATDGVLAGESLAGIVRDWNARGVSTTEGGPWHVSTLRRMLSAPRLAGRVVTKAGVDYGTHGPVVVEPETHARLLALLGDPRRRARVTERSARYLLTGILECGRCGGPMFSAVNSGKRLPLPVKIYRCAGCHLSRNQAVTDEHITEAVLTYVTEMTDPTDLLRVDDLGVARARLADLVEQRDGLVDLLALGVSRTKVVDQAKALGPQILEAERALAAAEGTSPLAPLLGAEDVAVAWEALSLEQQRAALRALPGVPVCQPLGRGARVSATVRAAEMRWVA
jgi:DNA invertase Pin-like site-specific DNA recombinase